MSVTKVRHASGVAVLYIISTFTVLDSSPSEACTVRSAFVAASSSSPGQTFVVVISPSVDDMLKLPSAFPAVGYKKLT